MFKKMPFLLVAVILCTIFLNSWIPLEVKSILYALSLSLKTLILFLLPFIIFSLLFKTATQMARKALVILGFVCLSNFLSTMVAAVFGYTLYHFDLSLSLPQDHQGLESAWIFTLPQWIANDHALYSGLLAGLTASLLFPKIGTKVALQLEKIVNALLKALLLTIPLFVAGFLVKLQHDGVIKSIFQEYILIFLFIAGAIFSYIGLLYLAALSFSFKRLSTALKNMLPAALTGFSTMSSAAAMPLTIVGSEKNCSNPALARAVIPTTLSIHLIGDCFAIPLFAFAILKSFGLPEPSLTTYISFAVSFMLAKFSVAAIPGGGIIVMLPLLESALGFDATMMSLITALYILFDPVITSSNILGNGAFTLCLNRLAFLKLQKT